ncbi:MAG: Rieske 2Fe-2S domain-containing protein [Candidatus Lustribacter sp.]|jgi:5,5'-dehydrodivanillate O-demethylase
MALTEEQNRRLTQVGPGTPGGNLLRRYWMPLCPASEITPEQPLRQIRILGEDLVVYRDGSGRYGLVPEQCPHRGASLAYGFIEEDGIRCPYHGWKFDTSGACVEQPFEPHPEKLMKLACRPPYAVQALAGLLWGYMGPLPAPLLPRWEMLVSDQGTRSIVVLPLHECNWLQAQENSVDPVHTYYLHAQTLLRQPEEVRSENAGAIAYFARPITEYDFELEHHPAWTGIRKVRHYGGDNPQIEHGHPAVFPNILVAPQSGAMVMHFRVPVDDTHTRIFWVEFTASKNDESVVQPDDQIPVTYEAHPRRPDGRYTLRTFISQDLMAWETQGKVYNRSSELLGASDRGVTMLRKLLREQIDLVEAGGEPVGIIRDPALNEIVTFGTLDDPSRQRNPVSA